LAVGGPPGESEYNFSVVPALFTVYLLHELKVPIWANRDLPRGGQAAVPVSPQGQRTNVGEARNRPGLLGARTINRDMSVSRTSWHKGVILGRNSVFGVFRL